LALPLPAVVEPPRPVAVPAPPLQRRKLLINKQDRDLAAVMYAEGWRQRVESQARLEEIRAAAQGSFEPPMVTVALRSNGSVESVTINRSSGSPALDEAVRQTVLRLAPYSPFPGSLSMDYDVVEIRRVWTLDTAVRLFNGSR
jgi:TonB family protein